MSLTQPIKFYAPEDFPDKQAEIRAYTIAAFRVAQSGAGAAQPDATRASEPLSLVDMRKNVVDFLIKGRALDYWKKQQWLQSTGTAYRLTAEGLAICQKAAPATTTTTATATSTPGAADIGYWEKQFRENTALPRRKTFRL